MKENAVLWVARDITERKQAENWLTGQKQILEMIAKGATLGATLNTLVEIIEQQSRDVIGSILFYSNGKHLLHGTAPSLPDSYNVHSWPSHRTDVVHVHCLPLAPTGWVVQILPAIPLWKISRCSLAFWNGAACLSISHLRVKFGTFGSYDSKPRPPHFFDA